MTVTQKVAALVKHEPALLLSVAGAGVAVGASFGLHLSVAQTREVYGVAAAATTFLIRQSVTPNTSAKPTPAVTDLVAQAEKTQTRVAALEAALSELAAHAPSATVLKGAETSMRPQTA